MNGAASGRYALPRKPTQPKRVASALSNSAAKSDNGAEVARATGCVESLISRVNALKDAGWQRNIESLAAETQAALRREHLIAAPVVTTAFHCCGHYDLVANWELARHPPQPDRHAESG